MELSYLRYDLVDGYIHNWLVAGPQQIPLEGDSWDGQSGKETLGQIETQQETGLTEEPAEWSRFLGHKVMIGDYEGVWAYHRTQEDHFIDLSIVSPVRQLVRAWAYTQVDVPSDQDVTLLLTAFGPVDVWINGRHAYHHGAVDQGMQTISFSVPFSVGRNAILVRFARVASGACTFAIALRVVSPSRSIEVPPRGAAVAIPTTITPVRRRRELERTFEAARLNQTVYERFDRIFIQFDPVIGRWARGFALQLQARNGETFAEAEVGPRPVKDHDATLGQAYSYPERFYNVVLTPTTDEYVNQKMWATRVLPFWGLDNNRHSDAPYGDLLERRSEALKQAARYPDDVYAEMAKMAISWWSVVEPPVILRAVDRVKAQHSSSARELLGLLGIQIRFGANASFPDSLRVPLEEAIVGYSYDHPASEPEGDLTLDAESDSLLLYVCETLAGQHFADRVFPASGQTGAWHRERGRQSAMRWLRVRAMGGFSAWDSGSVFAEIVAGLIHLVELVDDDELFEMATALLDKTLYGLALNSFKGCLASAHAVAEVPELLHGMLNATSGIGRLMWGMGTFNSQTMGYVSLACADDYGFPLIIQDVAKALPDGLWSSERHAPGLVVSPTVSEAEAVNTVMYRTPDTMLSSVQDYRPGTPGDREHVWQATLGSAAVVFTNHPACSSVDPARRPNYWRGNGVLPRVAQWQDVLIAVYALPDDDWLGLTHAYFPTYTFDAYAIRDGWAFAQKDNGYLALTAARGIALLETGMHARHEVRSYGQHNVWLCQMGRAAQDGTFLDFQAAVLGQPLTFDELSVRYTSLRGDALAFDWQGDLLRNGTVEPVGGSRHFDSPYGIAELPAEEMVIAVDGRALRLHFG